MKNVYTFAGLAFCACSGSSSTPIDATATSDSSKAVDAAVDARPRITCPLPQFAQPLTLLLPEPPIAAAIGDINGDGRPDIALVLGQVLKIYINAGQVTFSPSTDYPLALPSFDVAIGDLNNDGTNDVIVTYGNQLHVYPGTSTGALGQRFDIPLPTLASISHPVILDLNGDNRMDIVGAAATGIMVLRAKATAGFEAPVTYPGPAGTIRIGDFNGDGKQDVASLGINNKGQAPQVGLYLSNGNGTLTAGATVTNGGLSAREFAVADLNHDNKDDVVVSSAMGSKHRLATATVRLKMPS